MNIMQFKRKLVEGLVGKSISDLFGENVDEEVHHIPIRARNGGRPRVHIVPLRVFLVGPGTNVQPVGFHCAKLAVVRLKISVSCWLTKVMPFTIWFVIDLKR
jgi:hypothetical protein